MDIMSPTIQRPWETENNLTMRYNLPSTIAYVVLATMNPGLQPSDLKWPDLSKIMYATAFRRK